MFGNGMWQDRRTPEERRRDLERRDIEAANQKLAIGFLKNIVRPLLKDANEDVGIVGEGRWGEGAEMLSQADGVTYKITVKVDHDE